MSLMITNISYHQYLGEVNEWILKDVVLGKLNLIVGKNAMGKSMTINTLNALTRTLASMQTPLLTGSWDVRFAGDMGSLRYKLQIKNGIVALESLRKGRDLVLDRKSDHGTIVHYVDGCPKPMEFSPPESKLTNQVRRDKKELPFLEEITAWAENYHSYKFGAARPQDLVIMHPGQDLLVASQMGADAMVEAPYLLEKLASDPNFERELMKDLRYMGYETTRIGATAPPFVGGPQGLKVVEVQERRIGFPINQLNLSQGMYRAIALLVIINYLIHKNVSATVVIDDLGEGLDFDRSSRLTELVFRKARRSKIQLIVTSNDRFLMNAVDLKYWNIVERDGTQVRSYNHKNSAEVFRDFELTGLNNFDFFSSKYYHRLIENND